MQGQDGGVLLPRAIAAAVERVDRRRGPVAGVGSVGVEVLWVLDVLHVLEDACAEGDTVLAALWVDAVGDFFFSFFSFGERRGEMAKK